MRGQIAINFHTQLYYYLFLRVQIISYQKDGLAMGSPPAPGLANGWHSQFDNRIRGEARIYFRYMDDILRELKKGQSEQKLRENQQTPDS